jgi:hypothetical protein
LWLTLFIQNESPGKDKEANWIPTLKEQFFMAMRLYMPKAELLEGKKCTAAEPRRSCVRFNWHFVSPLYRSPFQPL